MFARALREFMLRPRPCTNGMRMAKGARVGSMRRPECGVTGTFVCWEAGAYVVVGRNAACSANRRNTDEGSLQLMHGISRQEEEDPEGQRQGGGGLMNGGAVQWFGRCREVTFSVVLACLRLQKFTCSARSVIH